MRIFYNKATGEVVGAIEGFSQDPRLDEMYPVIEGIEIAKLNIPVGHPQEQLARDIENPHHPLNLFDTKVDGGELRPMNEAEHAEQKAKQDAAREAAKAWAKANPPRDPLAELDDLKNQIATLQANARKPTTP